jgi:uncharacterized membrane protein
MEGVSILLRRRRAMKKSQLLTAMGLLTLFGLAMVAAGLCSLSITPNESLTQAWNELWEQHALFVGVAIIYCSIMLAFDVWVVAGILYQSTRKTAPVQDHIA